MYSSMRYALVRQMGSWKDAPSAMENCPIIGITSFPYPMDRGLEFLVFHDKACVVEKAEETTIARVAHDSPALRSIPITRTIWVPIKDWDFDNQSMPQKVEVLKMDVTFVFGVTPEGLKQVSIEHWVLDEITEAEHKSWMALKLFPTLVTLSAG